ncbi:hypothetical protein BJI67_11160 [Acidihalobacter aeolianus]|uniref:Uncharacterized protein n=1 Tax=Acidihalobacter aeolianus TaxID=2792603 RepID=A0A1D8K9D1_9GAMM|nr:hypothetical protein [Acidihalobacter aeolianus]AOV17545.1 hypothetical protein BJI67_11160 [Acidihalobacter aeolianus]
MRYHDAMLNMLKRILLTLGFAVIPLVAQAQTSMSGGLIESPTCDISAAQWESPDRSQTLLGDPALRRLLQAWAAQPGMRVNIEYPGGEQGVIWANRMVGWLVAFGVPKQAITLFPGAGGGNVLALSLRPSRGGA